jgi:hypothetical protein
MASAVGNSVFAWIRRAAFETIAAHARDLRATRGAKRFHKKTSHMTSAKLPEDMIEVNDWGRWGLVLICGQLV